MVRLTTNLPLRIIHERTQAEQEAAPQGARVRAAAVRPPPVAGQLPCLRGLLLLLPVVTSAQCRCWYLADAETSQVARYGPCTCGLNTGCTLARSRVCTAWWHSSLSQPLVVVRAAHRRRVGCSPVRCRAAVLCWRRCCSWCGTWRRRMRSVLCWCCAWLWFFCILRGAPCGRSRSRVSPGDEDCHSVPCPLSARWDGTRRAAALHPPPSCVLAGIDRTLPSVSSSYLDSMACYDIPERTNSVSSRNGDSLLDVASGTYELLLRFHADGLGAARWGASASVLPNLLPPRHGAASAYIPGPTHCPARPLTR